MDSPRKQSDVAEANILVADDESDVRELICEILADEKYHIASFDPHSSPEDLLHARYDVVILDIFMPKYDGFALHEEVKKHSPHAQFILITAHPEPDLVDRATRLGIYGFLTKPFTAEQIKYTVMGALRMRKLLHNRRKSTDAEATRRVDLVGALQRIDAIINSMGEGLLAVDNDNAIVLMNGVAEKITGIRFGESAGVRLECSRTKKEVTEYLLPRLARTIVENETGLLKLDTGEADSRYYSVNIQDVVDGSGERIGRVILFMDLTDAKNMEHLKESFISVAAHELRTPITVMMNYLYLLKKKGDDSEMLSIALEDMLSASRRMKYIVNGIITFIKLSAKEVQTYTAAVDIGAIIREEIEKLKTETKEKNVGFELKISLASARFSSDSTLVTIAVYNVLNNAVKFNRNNGAVRINVRNQTINGKPGIVIDVEDEGEGISPQVEGIMFEGFRQGEEHLTRIHSGLGTGLFLAQRAAMLLGGSLRAESLPERGSRFTLGLPCSRTADPERTTTSDNNLI